MAENPYAPPQAQVADIGSQEFQEVRLWSASGRIGRLRYLAYSSAATLVTIFAVGLVSSVTSPALGGVVALVLYIPLLIFTVLAGVQRSHDMDWNGWMLLLAIFVPFAGLIWVFKSGTAGENQFGAPPPPNTTPVKILAFILPALVIIGIVAAIAVPAFLRVQDAQQVR